MSDLASKLKAAGLVTNADATRVQREQQATAAANRRAELEAARARRSADGITRYYLAQEVRSDVPTIVAWANRWAAELIDAGHRERFEEQVGRPSVEVGPAYGSAEIAAAESALQRALPAAHRAFLEEHGKIDLWGRLTTDAPGEVVTHSSWLRALVDAWPLVREQLESADEKADLTVFAMDGAEYYFFASTSGADIHFLYHDEQHLYGPDSGVAAWVRARVAWAMDRLLGS